jgi:ribosome-associated protein
MFRVRAGPDAGDPRRTACRAQAWDGMLGLVPDDVRVNDRLTIPAAELSWRFSRSSGPGGQGVNTTDSRVEVSWDVAGSEALPPALRDRAVERLRNRLVHGVLTVTASEHRSQLRNREAAAARLAGIVAAAIAPPPKARRATRPSRASVERRIAGKKRRGETKRNRRAFPAD